MSTNTTIAATESQVVADLAQQAAAPKPLGEAVIGVSIPQGAGFREIDLERYLPRPRRSAGTYVAETVGSFLGFVAPRAEGAQTTVWVALDGSIVAVLNDHDGALPGHGDYRCILDLKPTDEWLHWTGRDGQLMDQETFAEHVEDGIPEIAEPPAADLMELAQTIQATTTAHFRSARRLQDGQTQVVYSEEIEATAGQRGELTIPQKFELAISPFVGVDPEHVTARLRYRVGNGNLRIGYRLERPDDVRRGAIDQIADDLASELGRDVYRGRPRPV